MGPGALRSAPWWGPPILASRSGRVRGRLAATTATAVLALGLVGCGSYTRHDYVLRAEGICNSTLRQLRLLTQGQTGTDDRRAGDPSAADLAALAAYLKRALPLLDAEARRLGALRRPSQTAAQSRALRRYLSALDDSVGELGALAAAARGDNPQQVVADERSLAASPLSALAAAYGLRVCSNPAASYT